MALGWTITKFRNLTPSWQFDWTKNHVPMKPAEKTLHQLMKEKLANKN